MGRLEYIKDALKKDRREIAVDVYVMVYNHEQYLKEALDGILNQKANFPIRILIHDDASTDKSLEIIKKYKNEHPTNDILVVSEVENLYSKGHELIWKKMRPLFTAKYIAICEGDDYWIDKNKLQKQVDFLEKHKDYSAVYHNIVPVDINSNLCEELRGMYYYTEERDYSDEEVRKLELRTQTATYVSRNYFSYMTEKDVNYFAESKANGDMKFFIICGLIGRIHIFSEAMAAHRVVRDRGESWSAKQYKLSEGEKLKSYLNRYIDECKFYNYLSGSIIYPYNNVIVQEINYIKKNKEWIYVYKPLYAYIVFVGYVIIAILKKICKIAKTHIH